MSRQGLKSWVNTLISFTEIAIIKSSEINVLSPLDLGKYESRTSNSSESRRLSSNIQFKFTEVAWVFVMTIMIIISLILLSFTWRRMYDSCKKKKKKKKKIT